MLKIKDKMINDIKSINIDYTQKDKTKLSDISKETWKYEITKDSLICLIDEHEPVQNSLGTFLLTCLLIFPLIAVRMITSHFSADHLVIIALSFFVSFSMAYVLSKAYYHYIRMSLLKKRVYKRENNPLQNRPLALLVKMSIAALFVVIFAITYFYILSSAMTSYMFVLLSLAVALGVSYGMRNMNHYRFVMSNAAFLLNYIERTQHIDKQRQKKES